MHDYVYDLQGLSESGHEHDTLALETAPVPDHSVAR